MAEGGTFYNDAVLRTFERLTGKEVIRPDIAGLMGAYGMALKAKDQFGEQHASSLPGAAEIKAFRMETDLPRLRQSLRCQCAPFFRR